MDAPRPPQPYSPASPFSSLCNSVLDDICFMEEIFHRKHSHLISTTVATLSAPNHSCSQAFQASRDQAAGQSLLVSICNQGRPCFQLPAHRWFVRRKYRSYALSLSPSFLCSCERFLSGSISTFNKSLLQWIPGASQT